jgi:hypothetical protein
MSSHSSEASDEVLERLYMSAMTAAKEGRLQEAAELLDEMMTLDPNFPDAWWNLGTFRAQLNQHSAALSVWDIYRRMVPDDWRARVKVIQACQALGDGARIERERNELLALRRSGTSPELMRELRYCREQFRAGDLPVVAYEIFEPAGEMRVFYQFLVGQPDGTLIGQYSLGSYDSTTGVLREQGKIGPEDRVYHLDWYGAGRGHTTFRFFSHLPSYDQARADVIAATSGSLPALSSFTVSPEGKADIHLAQDAPTRDTSMAHELGAAATGGYPPLSAAGEPAPGPPPSPAPPGSTGGRAGAVGTEGHGTTESLGGRMAGWARRLMGRGPRPN